MSEIFEGRWTARMDPEDTEGIVLFLIGMRVNKWWRFDQYLWIFLSMGKMLAYLAQNEESGLLKARNWFGRTTMQVGYWRSMEHLVRFASDRDAPHMPAWLRFYKRASSSGAVGIWHETYVVKPGSFENIYANMPRFGMGEVLDHVKVDRTSSSARQRVRAGERTPAAEPVAAGS